MMLEWISAAHINTTYFWIPITKQEHRDTKIYLYVLFRLNIAPFDPLTTTIDTSGEKRGIYDRLGKGVRDIYHSNYIYSNYIENIINWIFFQEFDIMTGSSPTSTRAALVDFTQPVAHLAVSFLIPRSDQSVNILSTTKPFQNSVYLAQ